METLAKITCVSDTTLTNVLVKASEDMKIKIVTKLSSDLPTQTQFY